MHLKQFQLFAQLNDQDVEKIKTVTTSRTLAPNELMHLPNGADEIYLVRHGRLKLYRDNSISYLKYIYQQWDVLGILPLLGQKENPEQSIAAINDVILLTVKAEPLRELLQSNINFCAAVQQEAAHRIAIAEKYVRLLHIKQVPVRLLSFLIDLTTRMGTQQGDFFIAENILTNQEIADFMATSRQSVNAVLNQLRRQNLLLYNSEQIGVHLSALKEHRPLM